MNEQKSAKQLADEEYAQRRDPAKFNRSLFRPQFLAESKSLEDSLADYHNAHKNEEPPAQPAEVTLSGSSRVGDEITVDGEKGEKYVVVNSGPVTIDTGEEYVDVEESIARHVDAPLPTWTVSILDVSEHRHVMTIQAETSREAMTIAFQRSGVTRLMNITARKNT